MNPQLLRKKAELTLIYVIPVLSVVEENSKLGGLQRKLQKILLPHIRKITNTSEKDTLEIIEKIHIWGKNSGWLDNPKHVGSLTSFCLQMIEVSPITYDPKILDILIDISDHLENNKTLYQASFVAGDNAAKHWQELFN